MANNKYSITCVHLFWKRPAGGAWERHSVFPIDCKKKKKFFPAVDLVAMKWNIHGSNVLLVSHLEEYYWI